jgi:hypothetical protein
MSRNHTKDDSSANYLSDRDYSVSAGMGDVERHRLHVIRRLSRTCDKNRRKIEHGMASECIF